MPRAALTPVLVAILSCGDAGGGATTDTGASTGSASTASGTTGQLTTGGSTAGTTSDAGTTADSGATSTTASATTEPGSTGEPGTTTEPGTSTSGTTVETTGDSSTGGQGGVAYAAFYVPGGLDRIVVRKADFDADLCTSVVFVWPMQNIQPDLFIPEMWSFQSAEIAQGTADCLAFMGPLANATAAADIFGSADWPSPGPCPGVLDIDATLVFPPGMPWVPAQDGLAAADLPIGGC